MYSLVRSISTRRLMVEQVPAIGASLVITEQLYKFHSFTLEALAFLGTWYICDLAITAVLRRSNAPAELDPR